MTSPDRKPIPHRPDAPRHLVVMGVSGSGKSTLALELADRLGLPMAEADEFHPPENIEKMSQQIPLTDEDRWPWLRTLRDWMSEQTAGGSIITCSALRRSYRDVLREAHGQVLFLHVTVDTPRLTGRLAHRSGHFMPASLLDSQLATLEALDADEGGVVLSNDGSIEDLIESASAWLTKSEEGSLR